MGGLVVDIELPDLDLRRRIVESRYAALSQRDPSVVIPDDVIEFIANRITGGGRELEGALNRVMAYQQFNQSPITLDLASMVLRDMSANPDQSPHQDRRHPEDRRPPFQRGPHRSAVAAAGPRRGGAAPDRHVSGQEDDGPLAARNRPPLRRARPFDRACMRCARSRTRSRRTTSWPAKWRC